MKRIATILVGIFLLVGCTPQYTDPHVARPTKGSPQAQVTVEEFADFQCPACGQAYLLVKELQSRFGERVLWKFMEYPLVQIHPYGFNAALSAECANDQGKFWEYYSQLYEHQDKLANADLYSYADAVGLNAELFKACYKSRAHSATIRADMAEGDKRQVNSTPTFFLNGERLADWTTLDARLNAIFATSTPASGTTP